MSTLVWMVLGSAAVLQAAAIDPKNPADVDRPSVTFTPDWRKMFYNETLTLGCTGLSNAQGNQTYIWYRNNNKLDISQQYFTIASIQLYDRAQYQCQTGSSNRSEAVRPHVITDLTILRVPRYVFEGDILIVKCDSRLDVNTTNAVITFYKNAKYLKAKSTDSNVFIGKVDLSVAGRYSCMKKALFNNVEKTSEDEESISVTELFSVPEIKIHPYTISMNAEMTLTCVTTLHPLKAGTELYFAFYKNGWHVQGLSLSNKYIVQSAKAEDSGDYTCEVRTATNSVWKMSQISTIQVQYIFKPVVTFRPNWNKILRGGSITLQCDDRSVLQGSKTYSWYKDNSRLYSDLQTYRIFNARDSDIGNYQCLASSGEKSDPVHLDVFFVWLILQVPHYIHEGDKVILTCRMWSSGQAQNTTFYKDDIMIKFDYSLSDLNLGIVSKNTSGKYKCTKFINTGSASKIYIAEEYISIADLFSPPEINSKPHLMVEGADMTLTCFTALSPLRADTKLEFAFYRDGRKVQDFSASDIYSVPSMQMEHSGNYTCEVRTPSDSVRKMSKLLSIKVQGMAVVSFTPNVGRIFTKESIALACTMHSSIKENQIYYWYKDNEKMNVTQQKFVLPLAEVEDSGYYQCQTSNTHISDHIRLDVSNADLIVQAPPVIYEGDVLTLNCHHRPGLNFQHTRFYNGNRLLKILESESELKLGKAHRNMTMVYSCVKTNMKSGFGGFAYTADTYVSVTELYSYLQIKVSMSPVLEGKQFTLSCDVALSPFVSFLRGKTDFQFAFYKNGQKVKEFSASNKYDIQSARKRDSGNYTCEVKSSTSDVTKMSQAIDIDIQEIFSVPKLYVAPNLVRVGDDMVITCDATLNPNAYTELLYSFYKNGKKRVMSNMLNQYKVYSARQYDSGEYVCEVFVFNSNIIKRSNITYVIVQELVSNVRTTLDHEDPEVMAGSNLTFTCSVIYGTSPSYTWLHNSKVVDVNCVLYQIRNNGKVLHIASAQEQHSGSYQCQASNTFSTATGAILKISVIEPIAGVSISMEMGDLDLASGDSVTFICAVSQGMASSFLWLHNNETVDKDAEMYSVKDNGKVLHIESTQARHGGTYQCKAIKNLSVKRNMVLSSDLLTISISDKSHSYLVSTVLLSLLLVIILISGIVYKYQSKLVPSFIHSRPEQIRASVNHDKDSLLGMDSLESCERFSNSHH
ncbi:Fc receptor-like A [Pseudophryne corroboree]|uniref:Fc receptor-like A n=1 Tax=Pseudophryne corroboree TaxID=495146 RepID=UPI00308124B2